MWQKVMQRCAVIFWLTLCAVAVTAQQQVGIPLKADAFVIEFIAPYAVLRVDFEDNNFTNLETSGLAINAQTQFLNKKDKPLDKALLRPGMRIEVRGERFGEQMVANRIKAKIDVDNWETEVKGYLEKIEGDKAWVDGQALRLAGNVIVLGDNEWKGKTFRSFGEMMVGSNLEVKGVRGADGVVTVKEGKTKPNLYSNADKNLVLAVQKGLLVPTGNSLAGGQVKIGNQEFKLVESLELQAYVTRVGYKLIPRYMKELPGDYPGKMTYRFYVVADDSFNAFALPDGSVFVHTGLLKALKNEAQLAAVIGHEIAHVTHEHSRRQMETNEKMAWLNLAVGVAGAAAGSDWVSLAGQFGLGVLSNKFGRGLEDQADRVGLFYMYEAGYDPREAPKVWRQLSKTIKSDAVSNFLYSDHSSAVARLRNLNREIAYSYYDTAFSQTITGEDKYIKAVGPYFGWLLPVAALPVTTGRTLVNSPGKPAPRKATFVQGLPVQVRNYLNDSYSGWKQTVVANGCFADYKKSVVMGDFDGNGRRDYVVKFVHKSKGYFIAFLEQNTDYEPHILLSVSATEIRSMGLTVGKKGEKYSIGEVEDNKYGRLPYDTPIIGVCESEACPYIYRNGSFQCS